MPVPPTSAGDDVDRDGHAVADGVEHRGAALTLRDDLSELLGRSIALDPEGHPYAFESVADLVREAERAPEIDVALQRGLDSGEADAACRGRVDERRGQARG